MFVVCAFDVVCCKLQAELLQTQSQFARQLAEAEEEREGAREELAAGSAEHNAVLDLMTEELEQITVQFETASPHSRLVSQTRLAFSCSHFLLFYPPLIPLFPRSFCLSVFLSFISFLFFRF
jgi:hypothetical protein